MPSKGWPISLRLATLAWLLAGCAGCRGEAVGLPDAELLHSVVGTCAAAEGKVLVRRVGFLYWEPVAVGSAFRAGDWLRTEALSSARVEFIAGSGLDVGENTTVVVDAALLPTGREHPLVTVTDGATEFSVRSAQGPIGLKNPDGSVTEVDTEEELLVFRVEREGDSAQLAVSSGSARVALQGRASRKVKARESVRMSRQLAEEKAVQVLDSPILLDPAPDSRIAASAKRVRLTWEPVEGAVTYRYQVARDARFRRLANSGKTAKTAAELSLTVPGGYYWRVAARDAEGRMGEYGAPRRLVLESGPLDLLLGPDNGAVLLVGEKRTAVTFSWKLYPETQRYRLAIGRKADLSDSLKVSHSVGNRLEVPDLPLGTYFWGVWAEGEGAGEGAAQGTPLFSRPHKVTLKFSRKQIAPRLQAPKEITW